jgi:hypothetical protein
VLTTVILPLASGLDSSDTYILLGWGYLVGYSYDDGFLVA